MAGAEDDAPEPREPKVTIRKPSEAIIAAAQKSVQVTDNRGRVFTLQRPGFLAQTQLIDMLGQQTAGNQVFMGIALPLTFITAIDGDPVFFPATRRQLDALIERVEEESAVIVMGAVQEHFGTADTEAAKEAIKN